MLKMFMRVLTNKELLVPKYNLYQENTLRNVYNLIDTTQTFIFDKDDTLVPLHQFQITNPDTIHLLTNLFTHNKKIYIVSNSVHDKGYHISYLSPENKQISIQIMHTKNKKPFNGEQIKQFIENQLDNLSNNWKLSPKKTAIIGDRLMTEILLGNLMGWTTVLVKPVQQTTIKKHGIQVYILRHIEKLLLRII